MIMAARILIDTLALLTGPMDPEMRLNPAPNATAIEFRFHAE